jgi:hypothetical protein
MDLRLDPKTMGGFITWTMTGFVAALIALFAAQFIPSLIPQRAISSKVGL